MMLYFEGNFLFYCESLENPVSFFSTIVGYFLNEFHLCVLSGTEAVKLHQDYTRTSL